MNGTIDSLNIGVLLTFVITIFSLFYYIRAAKKHANELYVRRIPGVDAIDETVGRAAELGRPIAFTTGVSSIDPILYACLGVLNHVAKKAARLKTKLLMPHFDPQVMALSEDVIRDAYSEVKREEYFNPRDIIFLAEDQFAYAAGYMGLIEREKVAGAFLFGTFRAESLLLAQAGQDVGAMQIAATVSPEQAAFFIASCDYALVGEELFAASSYLNKEPVQLGSLYTQDRTKLFFIILILIGVVIATINSCMPDLHLPNVDKLFY